MAGNEPGAAAGTVDEIVERYSGDADMLIPMMQDVQAECGYLPREELSELARALGVPIARVYGIATFYASFRLMPKGDHTIQLCMGTVCFLKGAEKISEAIRNEFDLVPGGTSPDGKFTFSPVNCVGACALAPVMVVDGEYHGGLTVDSAVELLHEVAKGTAPAAGEAEAPDEPPTREAPRAPEPTAKRAAKKARKRRKAGKTSKTVKTGKTRKVRKKGK
jgi:NADH-quinone oxidoreductase subunit E